MFFFFLYIVLSNEFEGEERVKVERFKVMPSVAQHIEVGLSGNGPRPDKEFLDHLMTHASNAYEGRIVKPFDCLCFSFYARKLILEVCNIRSYPNSDIEKLMNDISLNDKHFYLISSSTTWSLKAENVNHNVLYPITNIGGLFDIYDKVINIASKTKCQSEYQKKLYRYLY